MLYEFRSRATGSVTLVGRPAEQILNIIGKPITATGIITVAQIPAAIAALENAAVHEQTSDVNTTDDDCTDEPPEPTVSLRQRIYPLIDLMRAALAADVDVTWGV